MRVVFDGVRIELCWGPQQVAPDPGWSMAPHAHGVYEGHFVMEGIGVNYLGDQELELSRDIFYLAPPYEIHAQRSDPRDPVGMYFIGFQLAFEEQRDTRLPHIYSRLPAVCKELAALLPFSRQTSAGSRIRDQLRLMELLWSSIEPEVARIQAPREVEVLPAAPAQQHILQAIAYTQAHLCEHPGIEQIADYCGISPRHLSRIFSATMNLSVFDYVQHERFALALSQLRNTSLAVREISDGLNFSSIQYFNQWFKKLAFISPDEFRRQEEMS